MPPNLLIIDDSHSREHVGGVQLVNKQLVSAAGALRIPVAVLGSSQVDDAVRTYTHGSVLIYVQKAGYLSASYARAANSWLEHGATIVEKNVFAKASRHRPRNPKYFMSLMSLDGLARYSLRSFASGTAMQNRVVVAPNPALHDVVSVGRVARSLADAERGEVHLLRVGRPDRAKWSDFELEFVAELSRQNPILRVHLVRVGYFTPSHRQLSERIRVSDLPYGVDMAQIYRMADVYIHHSRIGETFGNTIAEAVRAGLPVIHGLDAKWDCASAELLHGTAAVYGDPRYLVRDAGKVWGLLKNGGLPNTPHYNQDATPRASNEAESVELLSSYVKLHEDGCNADVRKCLGPAAAARHIRCTVRRGWKGSDSLFVEGLLVESARAVRDRWRREEG